MTFELSAHAKKMLLEREISEKWIQEVVTAYERIEKKEDGTVHYLKRIQEWNGRYLRVSYRESLT